MSEIDSAKTTVTDLVRKFAEACRALVPSLDQAGVPWADNLQYDNWDRVAEALFESLVLEPCRLQAAAVALGLPITLARYGVMPNGETAFVSLKANSGADYRFVQLLSVDAPFDYCKGALNDDTLALPIDAADLSFVLASTDGTVREISSVILAL